MIDQKLVDRFQKKFKRGDGCWEWQASTAGLGYGQIKLPGTRRQVYAHRLSWEIHCGSIPAGKQVLHRCDNPKCVRPDHLFLGDAKANRQDMKSKGRHLYGSRNARAKLSEGQVQEIHRCLKAGLTQRRIAAAFGISQVQVSRIARGLRWERMKPEAP